MDETVMSTLFGTLIGALVGAIITFLVSRHYYRQSSAELKTEAAQLHAETERLHAETARLHQDSVVLARLIELIPGVEAELKRRSNIIEASAEALGIGARPSVEPATLHLVPGEVQAFGENRPPASQEP